MKDTDQIFNHVIIRSEMKLQWKIVDRWRGQTTHQAIVPQGHYTVRSQGNNHYPTYFKPNDGTVVDIGFDEPWNVHQAKKQCQAHFDLGCPVPVTSEIIFAQLNRRK